MTLKGQAEKVLRWAEKQGFEAEVYLTWAESIGVTWKDGDVEQVDFRRPQGAGLLIRKETKTTFVDSNDLSDRGLEQLLERAVVLFRFAREDPGYVMPEGPLTDIPPLKMVDLSYKELDPQALMKVAEQVAKAFPRSSMIALRRGSAVKARFHAVLLTSKGKFMERWSTSFAIEGEVRLDARGEKMEGSARWTRRFWDQLPGPDVVAQRAYQRARAVLGGKPIQTAEMPVVFEPDAATRLVIALFQALNGENLNKKRSFLAGHIGEPMFSPLLTVIEDPFLAEASGLNSVDDEGTPTQRKVLVDQGVPKQPVDHLRSAKAGHRTPTGNGFRSYRSRPGIGFTNLYLAPGQDRPDEILASVDLGLYVMGTLGFGIDIVSGNFSTGAFGRLISKGELTHPVQGVTIALDLRDLYAKIDRVGNDLEFRTNVASPTILVRSMKIAGKG